MKQKLFMAVSIAALVLTVSCRQEPAFEQTEEVGPYTVSLIEKDVWHIEDCNSSNPAGISIQADGSVKQNNCSDMYIIRGKDKALLIDLSNKITWAEGAEEALRSIFYSRAGEREKLIAITHSHGDHLGMLPAFQNESDVRFLLPEKDFAQDNKFPADRKTLIADSELIDLGGMQVECVEVQGHTPGSMVFALKGHNILFSGDAIGSGSGVWIFSLDAFRQYASGVAHLMEYVQNPANGIDPEKLIIYGGHSWQKTQTKLEKLDMQYLLDMSQLVDQIGRGEAAQEPYSTFMGLLDTNFKYGTAIVTWNKAQAAAYAEELGN